MNRICAVCLFVLVAGISSCGPVPVRPAMEEVQLPPQRIVQKGYSILPLNEPGWLVGYRNQEKLVLGKRASDPDENFVIRSFAEVLPPLKSEEEFTGFAKSVLIMEGAARHKVISQEAKRLKVKGQKCVRTDTVMEDHGAAKRSSRTEQMILEIYSLLCKHPNGTTGILVAYSHRYYQGNRDQASERKAQTIFDSIEFLDL